MSETKEPRYLWSFYWDYGRNGDVTGLFVATEKQIQDAIGETVYFGEILGKHSEVFGVLDWEDLEKVDIPSECVESVTKNLGATWSGYNPLRCLSKDNQ